MSSTGRVLSWGVGVGIFAMVYGLVISYTLASIWGFGLLGPAGQLLYVFDPINLISFFYITPLFPHGTLYGITSTILDSSLHFVVGFGIGVLGSWVYEKRRSRIFRTQPASLLPWIVLATLVIIYSVILAFFLTKATAPSLVESDTMQEAVQVSQPSDESTDNWKTFVNTRDGYSVRYPEDGGSPFIDSPSGLKKYGFETSVTFIRYGGWADIYIFNGPVDAAISAYEKIDPYRLYLDEDAILIGGKEAVALPWTRQKNPSLEYSYFVEYQPNKTLYISGPRAFVGTIEFI